MWALCVRVIYTISIVHRHSVACGVIIFPQTVILNTHSTKQCQNYQIPTLLQYLCNILLSQGHPSSTRKPRSKFMGQALWRMGLLLSTASIFMQHGKQSPTQSCEDPALNLVPCLQLKKKIPTIFKPLQSFYKIPHKEVHQTPSLLTVSAPLVVN